MNFRFLARFSVENHNGVTVGCYHTDIIMELENNTISLLHFCSTDEEVKELDFSLYIYAKAGEWLCTDKAVRSYNEMVLDIALFKSIVKTDG